MRLHLVYSAVPTTAKHLNADRRRALEMLAAAGWRGCTGATLLARGLRMRRSPVSFTTGSQQCSPNPSQRAGSISSA
jgi:hypothetical protein